MGKKNQAQHRQECLRLFLWGRLATCGRLAIGPSDEAFQEEADYQSAAGYQPAPHRNDRTIIVAKPLSIAGRQMV
jgi:hypothetical protein